MKNHLAFLVFGILSAAPLFAQPAATTPQFTISPRIILPGGSFTMTATGFPAASNQAMVRITSVTGTAYVLSMVPMPSGGGFVTTFQAPAAAGPGRYLVTVIEANGIVAINVTGTLTIVPSTPWIGTASPIGRPGGSVTMFGFGFPAASTGVAAGLFDSSGNTTILGNAALNFGGFARTFPLSATAPARAYAPIARDNTQQTGLSVTGQFTISAGPVAPVIPVGGYPIGAAVNPATNRLYVPNGSDNNLSVINTLTNAVIATIPVGTLPCAIGLNPLTNRVYVANLNTHNLTVIDGATNTVITTIVVGPNPCAMAVLPRLNRVYVGNYQGNNVTVVNGATNSIIGFIPIGSAPFGMGANTQTNRVYVCSGYDKTVAVVDGTTNTITARIPVGNAPDAIGVNPVTGRVYVANYLDDTLTVVDGNTNTVLATLPTGKEPAAIAVNASTGRVFISNFDSATVTVVDGGTNTVAATLEAGLTPDGMAANPFTNRIYNVNSNSNTVSVITDTP